MCSPRAIAKVGGWVLALVLAAGCATPVEVEGDLPRDAFEERLSSLTKAPNGGLHAVASRGMSPSAWVLVEYDGRSHLFATASVRQRSARLLALGEVEREWINEAIESGVRPQFVEPSQLASMTVDDPIGWWSGDPDHPVEALGDQDFRGRPLLMLPADHDESVDRLASAARARTGEDGRLSDAPSKESASLVVADGRISERGPQVAVESELSPSDALYDTYDHWRIRAIDLPEATQDLVLREMALEQGVQVVIVLKGDRVVIGFGTPEYLPEVNGAGLEIAMADSGFSVPLSVWREHPKEVLSVVDDLYHERYLGAFIGLIDLDEAAEAVEASPNSRADELRRLDLIAAGGLGDWHHHRLMGESLEKDADQARFLARSSAYRGDWEKMEVRSHLALELYSKRGGELGHLGRAHTHEQWARTLQRRQRWEPLNEHLHQSRDQFRLAGEPARAALVERRIQWAWPDERWHHVVQDLSSQGLPQQAKIALLAQALGQLMSGDLESTARRLELFADTKAQDAGSAAMRLYRAVDLGWRVIQERHVDMAGGPQLFDEAWERRDPDALSVTTWILHEHFRGAIEERMDVDRFIAAHRQAVERGVLRDWLKPAIDKSWGFYCAPYQPVSDSAHEGCSMDLPDDNEMKVSGIIERGYQAHILNDGPLVEAIQAFLDNEFSSAAHGEDWRGVDELTLDALLWSQIVEEESALTAALVAELRELASEKRHGWLTDSSRELERRGFYDWAIALQEQAVELPDGWPRQGERFQDEQRLAGLYFRAQRWEDLKSLTISDSPLHAAALTVYQAHAAGRQGDRERARQLSMEAREAAGEFGLLHQLSIDEKMIRLALDRGDLEFASGLISGAWNTLAISELQFARPQRRVLSVRMRLNRARLLAAYGLSEEADQALARAIDEADELSWEYRRDEMWRLMDGAAAMVDSEAWEAHFPRWREYGQRVALGRSGVARSDWLRFAYHLHLSHDRLQEARSMERFLRFRGEYLEPTHRQADID